MFNPKYNSSFSLFLHIHEISSRKIALKFGVGRTQIQSNAIRKAIENALLFDKDSFLQFGHAVLEDYYNNISGEIKRRRRTTGNDEFNILCWL